MSTPATIQPPATPPVLSSDLLCCPFCGGEAKRGETADGGYFVECTECQASSKCVYPDKTDPDPILLDAWNSRSAKSMENEPRCPDCNGTLRKCGIDTYKCRNCGEGWTVTAA